MWKKSILRINSSLQDAIQNLNDSSSKIIMVVDEAEKLIGTITDGDIRRGLLRNLKLPDMIENIINYNPIISPPGLNTDAILELMESNKVQHIPVVDKEKNIIGLYLWEQLKEIKHRDSLMIIMAGGKGTRLLPYSKKISKTMLEVSGKPILHRIIDKAKKDGFHKFIIAVNHLSATIEDYFVDGKKFNVKIDYIREEKPLGTAGALSLIKQKPEQDFIVTNGDVLVDLKYSEILDFHKKLNSYATMAVKPHEIHNPFGVVEIAGSDIINIKEKPSYKSYINAGVYALSPKALKHLKVNQNCNMTTLFEKLKKTDKRISAFPIHEYWIDIGFPEDLKKATIKEN